MNNCPNCNSQITCGCQKKTASDGKQVCSACIQKYEQTLHELKLEMKKNNQNLDTLEKYTE